MAIGDLLKVSREDIQDFPGDSIDLIMEIQKEGWRAQRSNRNHVMLLAPDGETRLSVSRNSSSAKYLAEDIRRYKAGKEAIDEVPEEEVVSANTKFTCPQADCQKFFASQDYLNVHIGVDHEGMLACPYKDCFEIFTRPTLLGRHRQLKHGYISPTYAKRKAAEAKRDALKEVVEDIVKPAPVYEDVPWDEKHQTVTIREKTSEKFSLPILFPQNGQVSLKGLGKPKDVADDPKPSFAKVMNDISGAVNSVVSDNVEEDPITFIDERDSWVLDIAPFLEKKEIRKLQKLTKLLGLDMEIRVWKAKQ